MVSASGQIFRSAFHPQDEIFCPGMPFRPLDEQALKHEIFVDHEPEDLSLTDRQLGRFISESNYRWFPHDEEPEDPD